MTATASGHAQRRFGIKLLSDAPRPIEPPSTGHDLPEQAVQLDTSTARLTTARAREDLLHKSDPILRKSDQSAYSIVPSRMSTSTCRTSMRYVYQLGHVLGAARHVLGRIGKVIPIYPP